MMRDSRARKDTSPERLTRRQSAAQQLAARVALTEARAAFDGILVVLKGLEIATRYNDPTSRFSGDVDILTDQPNALQKALIDRGWEPLALVEARQRSFSYDDHHHLHPLTRPGLPATVEVHRTPGWLPGMTPPSTTELLTNAGPASIDVPGVQTLEPGAHGVYLAVHSWRERPSGIPGVLTDIALVIDDRQIAARATELAEQWGVARIWSIHRHRIDVVAGRASPGWNDRLFGDPRAPATGRTIDLARRIVGRFYVDHPLSHIHQIVRGMT